MLSEHKWTECAADEEYIKTPVQKFIPGTIPKCTTYTGTHRPFQPSQFQLYNRFKPRIVTKKDFPPNVPTSCKLEVLTKEHLNERPLLKPWYWKVEQVADWIEEIGFPQYRECFEKNFITGRNLLGIEAKHLPMLNITDFEHIKIIVEQIRELFDNLLIKGEPKIWEPPMHPYVLYMLYKPYTTMKMIDFFIKWRLIPDTHSEKPHYQKCSFEVARYYITHKMDQFLFEDNIPVKLPHDATTFLQSNNFYW